jgi:pyruvate/2-oxoglutarate dehydrogenase complex dihydrolipoamide acyltransferase (E2) component
MNTNLIRKSNTASAVQPNVVDYEATRRSFEWGKAAAELGTLPDQKLNIAHTCVDRHATGSRAHHVALRWLATSGACLADVENVHREHAPRISPVAKKMADEHQLDVGKIQGHGPHGAIEKSDVEAALRTAPICPKPRGSHRFCDFVAPGRCDSSRDF